MNKNDKFRVAEFEVSAQAVTDEKLEGVAGGYHDYGYKVCPHCGQQIYFNKYHYHVEHCLTGFPEPDTSSRGTDPVEPHYNGLYTQNS